MKVNVFLNFLKDIIYSIVFFFGNFDNFGEFDVVIFRFVEFIEDII